MWYDIELLSSLRIPRCCFLHNTVLRSAQLHGFCDASEHAYAAVLYLSSSYENGCTDVKLNCSKTRVSPTKRQSILRLELLGAVILARLAYTVIPSLPPLAGTKFWTDSMTVLHWIRNRKNWKQYVQHRVDEIRQLTDADNWNHCPGSQNPAELPSRGLSASELLTYTLWWNGPCFIAQTLVNPPLFDDDITEEAQVELARTPSAFTQVLMSQEVTSRQYGISLENLMSCSQYSSLEKLLRVTAYILRFVNQVKGVKTMDTCELSLRPAEIVDAETLWIRSVQLTAFERKLQFLLKPSGNRPPLIDQFGLFIDAKQTLRCRGRINHS